MSTEEMDFLQQSIKSHDQQIGENSFHIARIHEALDKLVAITNEDATAIRSLARIAESHERRISIIGNNGI